MLLLGQRTLAASNPRPPLLAKRSLNRKEARKIFPSCCTKKRKPFFFCVWLLGVHRRKWKIATVRVRCKATGQTLTSLNKINVFGIHDDYKRWKMAWSRVALPLPDRSRRGPARGRNTLARWATRRERKQMTLTNEKAGVPEKKKSISSKGIAADNPPSPPP